MKTPADPVPGNNMMHGPSPKVQFRRATGQLRARVEWDAETGVEGYPRAAAATAPAGDGATSVTCPGDAPGGLSGDLFLAPAVATADSLPALREAIGDCRRCKLAPHRTTIVFGVGNPRAALMFVGEGPGHDEDIQGEPFVGRAGQLLTEIITKGMRLRREDVYIANVVKCRPPGNRNPEPDEVAACRPFLERQIDIIRPRIIVALGTFAAQVLLGTRTPITRLRGQWHDYHGTRLMPTFHPAYLLRNPNDKRLVWDDIRAVMRELGLQPEAR
jgi:DNA polymerase